MAKEKKEKAEGACSKCQRVCFNIGLLLSFIFFIMIPVIHSYASSFNFLMQPAKWALIMGFSDFFIASFAILYLFSSLTIFLRFYKNRRLCRLDNCSFYIFTVGVHVLAYLGKSYVQSSLDQHINDFKLTCAELELQDSVVPADSFINEMNHIYKSARSVMCAAKCPCGMLLETKPTGIVLDSDGPTSVERCTGYYMSDVFGGDEEKDWQFGEAFAEMEEQHVCSGICNGVNDEPLDIFLFSNVNDGLPLVSCRQGLYEQIDNNIWYFEKIYLVVIILTGIMIGILVLILFCQCFLCFKRNCCKQSSSSSGKQNKKSQQRRAENGMVVGGADQEEDEGDAGEIEAATTNNNNKNVQNSKMALREQQKERTTALPPPSADDDEEEKNDSQRADPTKGGSKKQSKQKEKEKKKKQVDSQVQEHGKSGKSKSKKRNSDTSNDHNRE